jgi:hypothetical protein
MTVATIVPPAVMISVIHSPCNNAGSKSKGCGTITPPGRVSRVEKHISSFYGITFVDMNCGVDSSVASMPVSASATIISDSVAPQNRAIT